MARPSPKTALIAGGARGLPFAVARALAGDGFAVALCGRREPEHAAPALAALKSLGAEAAYFQADIARRDARFRLLQSVRQKFGRLDVWVGGADEAPAEPRDPLELGEEAFDAVLRDRLAGPFFLAQAAALWMIEQRQADPAFRGLLIFLGVAPDIGVAPPSAALAVALAGWRAAGGLFAARLAVAGVAAAFVPAPVAEGISESESAESDRLRLSDAEESAAAAVREIARRIRDEQPDAATGGSSNV